MNNTFEICAYDHYFGEDQVAALQKTYNGLLLIDECIHQEDQQTLNVRSLSDGGNHYRFPHAYKGLAIVKKIMDRTTLSGEESSKTIYVANSKYLFLRNYTPLNKFKMELTNVSVVAHPYSSPNSFRLLQLGQKLLEFTGEALNIASIGHSKHQGIRFPASCNDFLSIGVHDKDGMLSDKCPYDKVKNKPEITLLDAAFLTVDEYDTPSTFSGTSAAVNIISAAAHLLSCTKNITKAVQLKAAMMCFTNPSKLGHRLLCNNLVNKINNCQLHQFLFDNSSREIRINFDPEIVINKIGIISKCGIKRSQWEIPPAELIVELIGKKRTLNFSSNSWLVIDLDTDVSTQELAINIQGSFSEIAICIYGEKF